MFRTKRQSKAWLLVSEAQLHGIKRLADKKWRIVWVIALTLLMWGAVSNLLLIVSRFMDNPTTTLRKELYRAMNAGFPAVLVYPELDYQDSKVEALLDKIARYLPELNRTYIKSVIRQLAAFYKPRLSFHLRDLENIERLLEHNNLGLREVTESLTTSCEESIIRCRWRAKLKDCSKLFHMELSDNGYCCVFNGRSLKRELLNGTTKLPKFKRIGRYGADTINIGPSTGLVFVVNQSSLLGDVKRTYKWIVSTTPQRFVDSSFNHEVAISPGKEIRVAYDTKFFYVSESAAMLNIDLRRCIMPDAKLDKWPLQYFPQYHKYLRGSITPAKCGCFNTCHIDDATMSVADLALTPKANTYDEFYEGLDFKNVSIINVFVENRELFSNVRISYFTPLDLFAQLGGIFNVFYGCSVLSLYELGQLVWHSFKQLRREKSKNKVLEVNKKTKKNERKIFTEESLMCKT